MRIYTFIPLYVCMKWFFVKNRGQFYFCHFSSRDDDDDDDDDDIAPDKMNFMVLKAVKLSM
jgi:hypothetical protein